MVKHLRLPGLWSALLIVGCPLFLAACERPFIEVTPPEITVVDPDLSVVRVSPVINLLVEASSFRNVDRVEVNGEAMRFNEGVNGWEKTIALQETLTPLIIAAFDEDGVAGIDTVHAVFLPSQVNQTAPALPLPRGGHTSTLLPDGSVLVTGGSETADGEAHDDAYILAPNASSFSQLPNGLNEARTGHTATLLPDGRVLIVGGGRAAEITEVGELVESVETYDPITQQFETVPVSGEPIRRMWHTASILDANGPVLDFYGGRGDIRYGDDPRLGVRLDLRSFRYNGNQLVALNNINSAPFLEPIFGHTQTPITRISPGQAGNYVVAGSHFSTANASDNISFRLDFTASPNILVNDVQPLQTPRTLHASVTLANGFILYFGGRQATTSSALDVMELYIEELGRYFFFPKDRHPTKRFGHTATILPSGRILLLGGFTTNGTSMSSSEFFDTSFVN